MAPKRPDLPFWLSVAAAALLMVMTRRGGRKPLSSRKLGESGRPFGEPQSSEEPLALELRRAQERGRGRAATNPLQIPRKGWYDIVWRTYHEMQTDRLLSIAGGVAFFVLLAIFPAITALVSAYGLYFNASTIANNLSLLDGVVPGNVLAIVHEQASRIAANSGRALSLGIVAGILVSLWSAMSGVKAMSDALNVIYEQKESRSFIKLNLVALVCRLSLGHRRRRRPTPDPVAYRSRQPDRNAHPNRALAGAAGPPANRPCRTLPLRTGSPAGALAMGQRRQPVRGHRLDRRVVSVLLVSHELRQLQRYLWLARRGRWPDDLAVDFGCRGAARGRAQCRGRTPDCA
jgi:hypothetical protein